MSNALKNSGLADVDYREHVTRALTTANRYRLHYKLNRQALQILDGIHGARGETDPKILQQCDDYAREVFGWKGYAPWLYVYSATAGTFKEGWIPDNFYIGVVVPALKGPYRKIHNLKPLSRSIFSSDLFPDVAYRVNGLFFNRDLHAVDERDLRNVLFADRDKVVFKSDSGLAGRGVHVLDSSTFDVEKLRALPNGVFQEYIDQHPQLAKFMSSSVATLRITTVIDDEGQCSARASYLRIGRSAETHVISTSQMRVAIDLATGDLSADGYLPNWLTVDRHPDSQQIFAGNKVPEFGKCMSAVTELHKRMPFVRSVGWDVSVGRDGEVKVMEWNGNHNGIKFAEAVQGPCFADLHWERYRRP